MKEKKNSIRIIKKYQNRRLYDVSTSTYVVLDDIKQIIMDGEEIKVIEVKTNQDVTRTVLLQVLLEEEMHGVPMFSNDFIYQIIRFYGKAFQSSLGPFLEQGVDLFRRMQKKFYEQVREVYGKEKLSSGVELWKDFIEKQGPGIEEIVKEQMQTSTGAFLKMQEQLQQQTRQLLDYMQFPFGQKKGE
ncbi:MAG: polyhydroxyalkanoate synthesis repressor PhaR [Neisseriaceae bacterium]|jgi:polyhydroxyalkanoate synthesis repressor PhaR